LVGVAIALLGSPAKRSPEQPLPARRRPDSEEAADYFDVTPAAESRPPAVPQDRIQTLPSGVVAPELMRSAREPDLRLHESQPRKRAWIVIGLIAGLGSLVLLGAFVAWQVAESADGSVATRRQQLSEPPGRLLFPGVREHRTFRVGEEPITALALSPD